MGGGNKAKVSFSLNHAKGRRGPHRQSPPQSVGLNRALHDRAPRKTKVKKSLTDTAQLEPVILDSLKSFLLHCKHLDISSTKVVCKTRHFWKGKETQWQHLHAWLWIGHCEKFLFATLFRPLQLSGWMFDSCCAFAGRNA